MSRTKQKTKLFLSVAALLLLAFGVGCRGFFVNPTLTTITVGPANPSVELGQTVQMTATGTFDDGSTSNNVKNLTWSIDPSTDATISDAGKVTAVAVSTSPSTITATSGTVSGTTTVKVVLSNVTSILITPSSGSAVVGGSPMNFTASANVSGQSPVNITGSATWSVVQGGSTITTIQCTFVSPNEQCSAQSGTASGTYDINVTYPGTNAVGTATLSVSQ